MINGSDLLTPSQMQQAHTLEFIQTVENEIRKGNDNFFMIVPNTLYVAVNWFDVMAYARVLYLDIHKEYDIDEKNVMLHIMLTKTRR